MSVTSYHELTHGDIQLTSTFRLDSNFDEKNKQTKKKKKSYF
jgi:hypothetical protein